MGETPQRGREPLAVLASVDAPSVWRQREELNRPSLAAMQARVDGRTYRRPDLASESLDWADHGLAPRFLGEETAACVAALEPNTLHNQGADELRRFLEGAAVRGETALLVSVVGEVGESDIQRSALFRYDASVSLAHLRGSVSGRRLPTGTSTQLAADLSAADRDLAIRLRNRPGAAPWWALELTGFSLEGISGVERREPGGRLEPLVTNELGETLAGVWIPDGDDWRWYFVPAGTEWTVILDWLASYAIPEYVPDVLRRVRSAELVDDELLTREEVRARNALQRFETEISASRIALTDALDRAQKDAHDARFGLLYGTGQLVVDAVGRVLIAAGFTVVDLDNELGQGKSGDLLASRGGRHWLVEVKSAAGNASESLYDDLLRHLRTWPELGRPEGLEGGVLVVNHERRLSPLDRSPTPYRRAEFVQSLQNPVIPTLALFTWWRDGDYAAIADAVCGEPRCHSAAPAAPRSVSEEEELDATVAHVEYSENSPPPRRRRPWGRRGS